MARPIIEHQRSRIAEHHLVERLLEIHGGYRSTAVAGGDKGRFVAQIGELSATHADGRARQRGQVHILSELPRLAVDLQYL